MTIVNVSDADIIAQALRILAKRVKRVDALESPATVREYLQLRLAPLGHECFAVVFVDNRHRPIEVDIMFRGTLTATSVYPREIVKAALQHNAAGVIFAHNHPAGCAEPSHADRHLTSQLKSALALVDVRVLDHFIVTCDATYSFAERGLL